MLVYALSSLWNQNHATSSVPFLHVLYSANLISTEVSSKCQIEKCVPATCYISL